MRWFESLSIRRKLILVILVTSGIVLLLACAAFVTYDQITFRRTIQSDLQSLAEILGASSGGALSFDDQRLLSEEYLPALQARKNITSACFYRHNQVFAQYGAPPPAEPLPDGLYLQPGYWAVYQPVQYRDERVGTLYLQYADERPARLRRFSGSVAVILLGAFGLVWMLSSRFQRLISEPILQLAQTARQVSENKDYSVRTAKLTNDEVGFLVEQFNGMLGKIQEHEAELRQVNRNLQESEQKALSATQAKSQFLANMSHELRTPLNAIIGFSEILADQTFGELNPKQDKYVRNILASGRHLLQLINDILDLAKIEAGRLTLDRQPFNVATALDDVQNIVRSLANKKRIDLILELEADLPALPGDQPKFKQIMYNLLSNAIKFTPESGRVTVTAKQAAREALPARSGLPSPASADNHGPFFLWLAVEDTGIGIRPEDQERIFVEFEQVDSSYARQQHGTGLGLSLTKKLVEMHGGRLWVESEGVEGKGSRFSFVLPLLAEPAASPPLPSRSATGQIGPASQSKPLREPLSSGDRATVLVVEDDPQAGELLEEYLLGAGYSVARAWDGEEALRLARELRPFAITLDILLPKKSGWEVLTQLKLSPDTKTIPVVIVSISSEHQLGFSLGAVECLVKPVQRDHLVQALQRAGRNLGKTVQTVLAVDDDPAALELLKESIEAAGYRVVTALGGVEGLKRAFQERPDVLVLDLLMPEMSGFEVVRRLRANPGTAQLPIMIYTAKTLSDPERQELVRQVQGIASKTGKQDLLQELQRVVNQKA